MKRDKSLHFDFLISCMIWLPLPWGRCGKATFCGVARAPCEKECKKNREPGTAGRVMRPAGFGVSLPGKPEWNLRIES